MEWHILLINGFFPSNFFVSIPNFILFFQLHANESTQVRQILSHCMFSRAYYWMREAIATIGMEGPSSQ